MKYRLIPNSNCEAPCYYSGLIIIAKFDKNLKARNVEILRRVKASLFGGGK